PATPADRLQPRGAAARTDGEGRRRQPRQPRRQARGPGPQHRRDRERLHMPKERTGTGPNLRRGRAGTAGGAAALLRGSALGPVGFGAAPRPAAAALTGTDHADIQRVERYFNDVDTLKARFRQIAEDGGIAQGTIYLRRPGRMRVEYDPPVPVLLV